MASSWSLVDRRARVTLKKQAPAECGVLQRTQGQQGHQGQQGRWRRADAQRLYREIIEGYSATAAAPEAMYWEAVSQYKATNDHTALQRVAGELKAKYAASIWTAKASVWG
jgi:hypothetical protein